MFWNSPELEIAFRVSIDPYDFERDRAVQIRRGFVVVSIPRRS